MDFSESQRLFARVVRQGSFLGLERVSALLRRLGEPQKALRCVHVAGTNGKGSIAAMTACVLKCAGLRTGLYTSPALTEFNERMSIDGVNISDGELRGLAARVESAALAEHEAGGELPSEFEFVTAMAFLWFRERACDVVVLEVGLGGRLDATNVIEWPEVAVIAAIGFDHMAELGNTLTLIAAEKAAIIKPGCEVVSYPQEPEAAAVIAERCASQGASLTTPELRSLRLISRELRGQRFDYGGERELFIPLCGSHQLKNAAVVLETVGALRRRGFDITGEALRRGLASVVWRGRFEVLREEPPVVLDGAHNEHGVEALVNALRELFPGRGIIFVTGILADKDYDDMLRRTSALAECCFTVTPPNPRALSAEALAARARLYGVEATASDSVEAALALALERQSAGGEPVCCFGSLYMAGTIQAYFAGGEGKHGG